MAHQTYIIQFWKWVSFLGVNAIDTEHEKRKKILANRINLIALVIFICMLVLDIITFPEQFIGLSVFLNSKIIYVIYILIFNLFLAKFNLSELGKLSLCILPLSVVLFTPLLRHFVADEFFFWYAYAAITFSIIPHFIFSKKERLSHIIASLYCLLVVIFAEVILESAMVSPLAIVPFIHQNVVFLKAIQLAIYFFLNFVILNTLKLNLDYENKLSENNKKLVRTKFGNPCTVRRTYCNQRRN